jgi:hypothetical protein
MEETVRSMLQYKARSEQLKQEKTSLTVAYEVSHHCHMGDTPPPTRGQYGFPQILPLGQ